MRLCLLSQHADSQRLLVMYKCLKPVPRLTEGEQVSVQSRSLQARVDFSPEDEGVFYPLPCKTTREAAAVEG